MEKTFPTRGKALVFVENEVGLVAITAREGDGTQVVLEPDTPRHRQDPPPARHEIHPPQRGDRPHGGADR